jgi:hypothetical protein
MQYESVPQVHLSKHNPKHPSNLPSDDNHNINHNVNHNINHNANHAFNYNGNNNANNNNTNNIGKMKRKWQQDPAPVEQHSLTAATAEFYSCLTELRVTEARVDVLREKKEALEVIMNEWRE